MNPATVEFLRTAAIQALQSKQDDAAIELLGLMEQPNTRPIKALPLAIERDVSEGPAHDYHYWLNLIRQSFIPFMNANGRLRFTSHELLTWLENCPEVDLTMGDVSKNRKDNFVWRQNVSNALSALKNQGVLLAPQFGKEYEISKASQQLAELSCMLAEVKAQ